MTDRLIYDGSGDAPDGQPRREIHMHCSDGGEWLREFVDSTLNRRTMDRDTRGASRCPRCGYRDDEGNLEGKRVDT